MSFETGYEEGMLPMQQQQERDHKENVSANESPEVDEAAQKKAIHLKNAGYTHTRAREYMRSVSGSVLLQK